MKQECTDVPISWLELERYALNESKVAAKIEKHMAVCPACTLALQEIHQSEIVMPALRGPAIVPSRFWTAFRGWGWTMFPAMAVLALIWTRLDRSSSATYNGLKGGDNSISLLRENQGHLLDSTKFSEGDRFKVQLSCSGGEWFVDVVVEQEGQLSYPLQPATISCGNHVVVPGAFSMDGLSARVCAVLRKEGPPPRGSIDEDALCVRIEPERAP